MSRQIEEVENGLGLTYNTVYKRVDSLYNGKYYETPFIVVEKLNISQKLTFGYWIKLENVNNNIPTLMIAPTQLKKYAGSGKADKTQMSYYLRKD